MLSTITLTLTSSCKLIIHLGTSSIRLDGTPEFEQGSAVKMQQTKSGYETKHGIDVLTRSTLMSGLIALGSKVIYTCACWLGARKPEPGKAVKCAPRADMSRLYLVPTSPVFSTCTLCVACMLQSQSAHAAV